MRSIIIYYGFMTTEESFNYNKITERRFPFPTNYDRFYVPAETIVGNNDRCSLPMNLICARMLGFTPVQPNLRP